MTPSLATALLPAPKHVQIVSQIPSNCRTGFKMRFWGGRSSTFHWLLSFTSRRKYSGLVLCDTFSGLKLILSYECVYLVPLSLRGLRLSLPQQPELEKCHCPTPGLPVLQEVAVLVMFLLKATVVRWPSFFQLSFTTVASVLFHLFYFFSLLFCFCVPSPHLHLGFPPSRQASGSCPKHALQSCLCLLSLFSLGCLQFSWIFPGPVRSLLLSSSGGVLLKHSHVSCCCCN